MMSLEKLRNDRKKVAVDKETYENLKNFSRFNGLKLRRVIDALTYLLMDDDDLRQRVIELCQDDQSDGT